MENVVHFRGNFGISTCVHVLRAEMELGANILQFCSTLEYLKTTKYGLPTPTQLGDRIFVHRLQPVARLSLIPKFSAPCISELK